MNAPEQCPVCGAKVQRTEDRGRYKNVDFTCGAGWWAAVGVTGWVSDWDGDCRDAMTACLRTGATLHPTAVETAREALVAAVDRWNEYINGRNQEEINLSIAYRAYRAALAGAK